jgi:hypothetical protein
MVLWLLACNPPPQLFVEPFDGSSAVAITDPLTVHLDTRYPEGEPVPDDVLTVVDLDGGGFVEGTTTFVDGDVVFEPTSPWSLGGRYGWAVAQPLPSTRGPLLQVPPELVGESSFRVGGAPELLDAAVEGDALCLLFSGPVDTLPQLEIDGEAFAELESEPHLLRLPGASSDAHGRCVELPARLGDLVRYTDAQGETSAATVAEGTLTDAWKARHRWSLP